MKLPSFKRLIKSDYPDKYADLIDLLAASLNIGIEAIYNALKNSLSLGDNILCNVKDFQIQVDTTGKPLQTVTFTLDSSITSLQGLSIIKIDNLTKSTVHPTAGVSIIYTQTGSGVQIVNITGLPASYTWQIRVIAWG